MTNMNFNSKVPRAMQERLANVEKHDAFHSHAYAKEDPNGKRLGSGAAPSSFEDRIRQEFSRQYVNQYRHSRIGIPTEHAREQRQVHKESMATQQSSEPKKELGGVKARFAYQPGDGPNVSGRPNPSFNEPRGRKYNPYS